MIEDLLKNTFNLDFEILSNNSIIEGQKLHGNDFLNPKIKTDDLFKEFEDYVQETKEKFNLLLKILEDCNEQRKNLRVLLIRIVKEKSLLDKLIINEKNEFLMRKLSIHDELRLKIIDKLNRQLTQASKEISFLSSSIRKQPLTKQDKNYSKPIHSKHKSGGYEKNTSVKNNNRDIETEKCLLKLSPSHRAVTSRAIPPTTTGDNSLIVTDSTFSSKNLKIANLDFENQLKNLLSFDFNDEKYNIISASPISTPRALKEKPIGNISDSSSLQVKKVNNNSALTGSKFDPNVELKKNKFKSVNCSPEKLITLTSSGAEEKPKCVSKASSKLNKVTTHSAMGKITKKKSEKQEEKPIHSNRNIEDKMRENIEKYKTLSNFNVKDYFFHKQKESKFAKKPSRNNYQNYSTIDSDNITTPNFKKKNN